MPPELRRALARLARRQHGVASREELLAVGMTDETITWALATHQLVALFPGVYRVNGAPDTWRSRALAAQRRVERQLRRRSPSDVLPPLAVLRRLSEMSGPVDHMRSQAEHRLADACHRLGLPPPACNQRVPTTAGPTYELDLAWHDERLDVEVDGPHHLLPSQRRQDRVRDRHLRADGWEVVRFPVEELDDDVEDVARRIGAALRRRTGRPA